MLFTCSHQFYFEHGGNTFLQGSLKSFLPCSYCHCCNYYTMSELRIKFLKSIMKSKSIFQSTFLQNNCTLFTTAWPVCNEWWLRVSRLKQFKRMHFRAFMTKGFMSNTTQRDVLHGHTSAKVVIRHSDSWNLILTTLWYLSINTFRSKHGDSHIRAYAQPMSNTVIAKLALCYK